MKKLSFMNPDNLWSIKKEKRHIVREKAVSKIKGYVHEKYEITLSKELLTSDFLLEFIKQSIAKLLFS